MIFNILVFTTILLPLLLPRAKKLIGLKCSFALLFVLFGLQFEMTQDWPVYVNRWIQATEGRITQSLELEAVYSLIMRLCKPLGFFCYLMLCAIFNLWVFYKYLRKYVRIKWAWLMLAIFMLRVNFAMTYIDTNRQTLAITFTMLGMYFLLNSPIRLAHPKKFYIALSSFFLCAVNIHTSALIALPIYFFPLICQYIKTEKWLYLFIPIYFFSLIADFSQISVAVETFMGMHDMASNFTHYTTEIAVREKSIIEQGIYFVILFLCIKYFLKFKESEKPLVLAVIVFISIQGYAMYTMFRALFYYQVYSLYVIPILFCMMMSQMSGLKKTYVKLFLGIFICYCVFSFNRDMQNEILLRWKDFTTVFSANYWM